MRSLTDSRRRLARRQKVANESRAESNDSSACAVPCVEVGVLRFVIFDALRRLLGQVDRAGF